MEMTTENIIKLANYFGEDPVIACENAGEFNIKVNNRIAAAVNRIKEFNDKVMIWVNGKFTKSLNFKKCKIDYDLWDKGTDLLDSIEALRWNYIKFINMDEDYPSKTNAEIKELKNHLILTKKKFKELKESDEYKYIFEYKPNKPKYKVVNFSKISRIKGELIDLSAYLTNVIKTVNDPSLTPESLSFVKEDSALIIELNSSIITVINKLIDNTKPY